MTHQANAATVFSRRLTLKARDGHALAANLYEPRGKPRANLVIHGALAVPARFYARFAEAMAEAGLRVLSYDYRGVAESAPRNLRGFRADLQDWAERDAPGAVDFLAEHYGDEKTFALGHSFGGQVFAVDAASRETIQGTFLVASQNGYYGSFRGAQRLGVMAFWYGLLPLATHTFGYLPGFVGLGSDVPRGVAEQWSRWCKHEDYYLSTHPQWGRESARFTGPIRAVSFSDDWYAPRKNVEWLLGRYTGARITHEHLDPAQVGAQAVGHFGFFGKSTSHALWPRVISFIEQELAPHKTRHVAA
jgi:predicted alpha/beta hydrolase